MQRILCFSLLDIVTRNLWLYLSPIEKKIILGWRVGVDTRGGWSGRGGFW